jgi:hypothetical protein
VVIEFGVRALVVLGVVRMAGVLDRNRPRASAEMRMSRR